LRAYVRVGEVARRLGVSANVVRSWCDVLGVRPFRPRPGAGRLFSKRDVERLMEFRRLVRDEGMTLRGAVAAMRGDAPEQPVPVVDVVGEFLRELRDVLEDVLRECRED